MIGGERIEKITTRGSDPVRLPFILPSWTAAVVVDVAMDRAQWGRFTDFGLTLFDSNGRQLGKDPLEYAFGRLSVDVAKGQADRPVAVALFPGFADPADTATWSATISVRLYADTMAAVPPAGGDSARDRREPRHEGDPPVRARGEPLDARRRIHSAGRGRRPDRRPDLDPGDRSAA